MKTTFLRAFAIGTAVGFDLEMLNFCIQNAVRSNMNLSQMISGYATFDRYETQMAKVKENSALKFKCQIGVWFYRRKVRKIGIYGSGNIFYE